MNRIINVFMLVALVLLPGCGGTIVDLAKENFPQGKECKNYQKKIKHYLREINIYDQFNTIGLFDALWISDEIRIIYTDVNAEMRGKNTDVKHAFLRRQLKENKHYISFYVLSTHDNPLSINPVPWALFLNVDGKKYTPFEVKAVELAVEYKAIFGTLFNNHKTPYEVRFERVDGNGIDILEEGHAHSMELYFSSPSFFSFAKWNIDATGAVSCLKKHVPSVVKKEKKKPAPIKKEKKKKVKIKTQTKEPSPFVKVKKKKEPRASLFSRDKVKKIKKKKKTVVPEEIKKEDAPRPAWFSMHNKKIQKIKKAPKVKKKKDRISLFHARKNKKKAL